VRVDGYEQIGPVIRRLVRWRRWWVGSVDRWVTGTSGQLYWVMSLDCTQHVTTHTATDNYQRLHAAFSHIRRMTDDTPMLGTVEGKRTTRTTWKWITSWCGVITTLKEWWQWRKTETNGEHSWFLRSWLTTGRAGQALMCMTKFEINWLVALLCS